MLEILEAPGHVVAMKLSGELSGRDVETAYAALDATLKSHDRVSFFAEIDDSLEFTLDAMIKDVTHGLGQFGKLTRYYRASVVTDKKWIATLARVEGLVFAWMEVRVFPSVERDEAFAWASRTPDPVPEPTAPLPAISFIPTTKPDVVAYAIDGRVTEKDLDIAIERMNQVFEKQGKVRILGKLGKMNGFDLRAVARRDLFSMKSAAVEKVERYAVVGAPTWLRNFLELIGPMFKAEIRVFEDSDEDKAWEWLGAAAA